MPSGHLDVRYARSGDVSIAYCVMGEGDRDLLFVHGFAGNLEAEAEAPHRRHFDERLARFARLITFDRRGTGLSDRVRETPSLETRMDDVRAVLDAVGSKRTALFGTFEAAAMCMLFAATYPERTIGLFLYNPVARGTWAPDYPWAMTDEEGRRELADSRERWATPEFVEGFVRDMAPTRADDEEFKRTILRQLRLGASPSAAVTIRRMHMEIDIRDVLPTIRVPTLVLAMPEARDESAFVADRGATRGSWTSQAPTSSSLSSATPCTTRSSASSAPSTPTPTPSPRPCSRPCSSRTSSTRPAPRPSSATGSGRSSSPASTRSSAASSTRSGGPRSTRPVTASSPASRGRSAPSGARGRSATRCARSGSTSAPVSTRAKCVRVEGKIGGLAVNIGARVAGLAAPGEVLVSSTVKDLVAGAGLEFEDRGTHELKGVPGAWRIYAVAGPP